MWDAMTGRLADAFLVEEKVEDLKSEVGIRSDSLGRQDLVAFTSGSTYHFSDLVLNVPNNKARTSASCFLRHNTLKTARIWFLFASM